MSLIIPENYKSNLNGRETEKAIKFIKDTFQHEIISEDRMRQDKASNSHTEKKIRCIDNRCGGNGFKFWIYNIRNDSCKKYDDKRV